MDPITIVGFVSSIVQLITFSTTLVKGAREIYISADGVSTENASLEKTVNDLVDVNAGLRDSLAIKSIHVSLTSNEKDLQNLARDCQSLADELCTKLQSLKVVGQKKWQKAIRQTINCLWSEHDIVSIQNRLQGYKEQLNLRILESLRSGFYDNPSARDIDGVIGTMPNSQASGTKSASTPWINHFETYSMRLLLLRTRSRAFFVCKNMQSRSIMQSTNRHVGRCTLCSRSSSR